MLENEDIICISTIDWGFLWQRHQIFMQFLAENGNRVFYLENLNPSPRMDFSIFAKIIKHIIKIFLNGGSKRTKQIRNLTVITPLVIPFKNRFAEFLNKNLFLKLLLFSLKLKRIRDPLVWTYLATSRALTLIDDLKPKFLIYDCVFDVRTHPYSPGDIAFSENKIMELADLIFTDNQLLFKKCKDINPATYILPPGVDFEIFYSPKESEDSSLFQNIKRPRICFFGGIDQIRIDLELIRHIAQERPHWSILLIGPVINTDISILKQKNIFLIGAVGHSILPSYLKKMDVLILPYKLIPFSKSIFPAKIFECLATGKPIVSTALEELNPFGNGIIKTAANKEEFIQAIEDSLVLDNQKNKNERLKVARENSWTDRLKKMQIILEDNFYKKER